MNVYKSKYVIPSYELDMFKKARVNTYLKVGDSVAGEHSIVNKCSISDLQEVGLTWMIARSRTVVNKYVAWNEEIEITTYVDASIGFNSNRIIELKDKDDNLVATIYQKWAILDMKTGRPQRVDRYRGELECGSEKYDFPNIVEEIDNANIEITRKDLTINYSDIDSNIHVNNLKYCNWVMDTLDFEFLKNNELTLLDIRWIKQCFMGQNLFVVATKNAEDANKILFRIYRKEDEALVFEAYTTWRSK